MTSLPSTGWNARPCWSGRAGDASERKKARPRPLLAAQSLGVSCLTEAGRVAIRCLLAPVTFWEEQGAEREERIAALRAPGPTAAYRTTIKGMGPTVVASILAEIGDVARVASVPALIADLGLDPSVDESGQFQGVSISPSGARPTCAAPSAWPPIWPTRPTPPGTPTRSAR